MDATVAPPSGSVDATSDRFDLIIGVILPGIFCVLGILGNSASLTALSLDRSRSPTFYSLKALTMADILLLGTALLQQVIPIYSQLVQCTSAACRNMGYVRVHAWPVVSIAQMMSIWLTVLISAERFAAICYPLRSKKLRKVKYVRVATYAIALASILFNIPRFFEFQPLEAFSSELNVTLIVVGDTTMRQNPLYRYLYSTAMYGLLFYVIPLTSISIFNVRIVHRLREANRQWEQLNKQQQSEMKTTAAPLCIVIVSVITGTVSLLSFVMDAIYVGSVATTAWLQMYTAIANLLVVVNSAVNFVVFCLFGTKFRVLLRRVVPCWRRPTDADEYLMRRRFRHYSFDAGTSTTVVMTRLTGNSFV